MKKAIITTVIVFLGVAGYSQHLSLNLYGGYTFQDKVNFSGNTTTPSFYAQVNGGFMWGASLEGVNSTGSGLELQYQYQSTNVPLYYQNGGTVLNPNNNSATISYLLLNGLHYFQVGAKAEPYFGLGLGAAFFTSHPTDGSTVSSTSATKFAWDLKTGVLVHASDKVGIKIGAQLLSSQIYSQYYYTYYGYYGTYATLWQFGFTGGLVFNFGGH